MQKSLTFSQALWPTAPVAGAPARWIARNVALAVGFTVFLALCAHAQFRLGFSPVPYTGQTFAVLLTGALLGPRLGVATLVLYILEGWLGLPVYTSIGTVASWGYLLGFVLGAGVVGTLAEREWDRKPLTTAAMMALGSLVIYIPGVLWLSAYVGGLAHAAFAGAAVFLPWDAAKAVAAAALLPSGWHLLGRRGGRGRAA